MGALLVYVLKSSVCLAAFYLFYRLLLSKETYHRFNRVALILIVVLSVIVPVFKISTAAPAEIHRILNNAELMLMQSNPLITNETADNASYTRHAVFKIIAIVYLLGIIFFFGRNVYSLVRMRLLMRNSKREKLPGNIQLITHTKNIAPFSWLNYVVINETDMAENGDEILTHELAHVRHKHSVDLLFAELCIILQWFNPAAWLLKQELQNVHEYEADESVLKSGIDAKTYQLLLIKKAVGTLRFNSMANSFNHSKLKKRIAMMLKEKSNPWTKLRYLYVLPLMALAVTAFAHPKISDELNEISSFEINQNFSDEVTDSVNKKTVEMIVHRISSNKDSEEFEVKSGENEKYAITEGKIKVNDSVTVYTYLMQNDSVSRDRNTVKYMNITVTEQPNGISTHAFTVGDDTKPIRSRTIYIDGEKVTEKEEQEVYKNKKVHSIQYDYDEDDEGKDIVVKIKTRKEK